MKKSYWFLFVFLIAIGCKAQNDDVINKQDVKRIISVLASDEMGGRRAFTPQADKAAAFISDEFRKAGLQTYNNSNSYLQDFALVSSKLTSVSCIVNNEVINQDHIVTITSQPDLFITEKSGFEKVFIKKGQSLFSEAKKYAESGRNYLIIVDVSFAANFKRLGGYEDGSFHFFKSDKSVVFLLANFDPAVFTIEAHHVITEKKAANVVGILPGKSKKDEYVIFSGHYDHLGTGNPKEAYSPDNADTIYNGANDDAAGTTAVIMLAKYFAALNNNERTLVFAAFTAEEIGGYGSQYFSKQFDPAKVVAMFNIEMVGTESKWGTNSAYITGFEKTDMGSILQKNLQGTEFTFYPDPYPDMQLFYRSDNATLARLGVPAHTISTSKMDSEPHYHKVSDEVGTLDMENMTKIIKAIAISSKSIVNGNEAPTRVKVEDLR